MEIDVWTYIMGFGSAVIIFLIQWQLSKLKSKLWGTLLPIVELTAAIIFCLRYKVMPPLSILVFFVVILFITTGFYIDARKKRRLKQVKELDSMVAKDL